MSTGPVTLIVELNAKPENADAVFEATKDVIPEVMKEPHFIAIDLHRDGDDPGHILVVEKWESRDYLLSESHQASPHLTGYFKTIAPLLAEEAKWTIFDHVAAYRND